MKPFFKYISECGGNIKLIKIDEVIKEHNNLLYGLFNPSIIMDNNGEYYMTFRSCDYIKIENACYFDVNYHTISKNYFCKLNINDFTISEVKEIFKTNDNRNIYNGAEDIRLFLNKNDIYAQYSIYKSNGNVDIVHSKIKDELNLTDAKIFNLENKWEKNWIPVIGSNFFIRKAFFNFIESDIFDKKYTYYGNNKGNLIYCGSTQLLPIDDISEYKYITLVHKNFNANYLHKFILCNEYYSPIKESEWFSFTKNNVEYSCGISKHNNDIILPLAINDCVSFITRININDVIKFIFNDYNVDDVINSDFVINRKKSCFNEYNNELLLKLRAYHNDEVFNFLNEYIINNDVNNYNSKISSYSNLYLLSNGEQRLFYKNKLHEIIDKFLNDENYNSYNYLLNEIKKVFV